MDSDSSYDPFLDNPEALPNGRPVRLSPPAKRKRNPVESERPRPFKRHAGSLQTQYLDLLNEEIAAAAQRSSTLFSAAPSSVLENSQIGCTVWTAHEKHILLEAVARLGPNNLRTIAAQLCTKSEVEVAQYLVFLSAARDQRRQAGRLPLLHPVDIPAAVEVSKPCALALEKAADALSLRQEIHEKSIEEQRWGGFWRVDDQVAQVLDGGPETYAQGEGRLGNGEVPFAELFNVSEFLAMSRRIFMNTVVPEYNWEFVDSGSPAIRATALADFHSLAVSLTRRIIHSVISVAEMRIASKSIDQAPKRLVRQRDVQAAVASLGLVDRREFWAKAARRLRLNVVDDNIDDEEEAKESAVEPETLSPNMVYSSDYEEDGSEFEFDDRVDETLFKALTYDEVENQLLPESQASETPIFFDDDDDDNDDETASISSSLDDDQETGDLSPLVPTSPGPESQETAADLAEIFEYTAVDFHNPHSAETALLRRLVIEKSHDDCADRYDAAAARAEERKLWACLGESPPQDLVAKDSENLPPKDQKALALDDMYSVGAWRDTIDYVPEWETAYKQE